MKHILRTIFFAALSFSANAQVSYLDSTFNGTGILHENIAGADDYASAILARPNGKTLLVGSSYFDVRNPASSNPETILVSVVQFDENGLPDASFGAGGVATWGISGEFTQATAAVLQPDGKLLVTGLNGISGHFVLRFDENGALDENFGDAGLAFHPGFYGRGFAILVQPDGKILMGGAGYNPDTLGNEFDFLLLRLNPDGSIDEDFGKNGYVFTDFNAEDNEIHALALLPDGSIVAGGRTGSIFGGVTQTMAVRFLPDGTRDTTFGQNGIVAFPFPIGGVSQILPQPDGKIIVAGEVDAYGDFGFVIRLNVDGSRDATFEDHFGVGRVMALVPESDGSFLVGTFFNYTFDDSVQVEVFRYLPAGFVDLNFGFKTIKQPFGFRFHVGMALLPGGKIAVGGTKRDEFLKTDFCEIRLSANVELDETFAQNGFAVRNVGQGISTATSIFTDDSSRIVFGGWVSTGSFAGRLNANGSKDNSFSGDGIKPFGKIWGEVYLPFAAKQPGGKILVAGDSGWGFGVGRLLPDGEMDTGFGSGTNELSVIDVDPDWKYQYRAPVSVSIQNDGKIVVFGYGTVSTSNKNEILVVRFNPDGRPDSTFADNGLLVSGIATTGLGDYQVRGGAVLSDGKILVGGTYFDYQGASAQVFLSRYLPDGSNDVSFGLGGFLINPFSPVSTRTNTIAVQPDGNILICGNTGAVNNQNIAVGRLKANGSKDNSFGSSGLKIINTGTNETAQAVALQPDGKIVLVASSSLAPTPYEYDPVLIRLQSNGALDTSLAGTGFLRTELLGDNVLTALTIQPNGNYVGAGSSESDYLLVRYLHKLSVGLVDAPAAATEVLVYPNPVHGQATFEYTLPAPGRVSLDLLDLQGKQIHTFFQEENRMSGENTEVIIIPQTLAPGVYLLRVQTALGSKSVRIVLN